VVGSEERKEVLIRESGDGEKKTYYGPTADYLGSLKVDETTIVVPPPRYNKVGVTLDT
jgi:hypothetical protein